MVVKNKEDIQRYIGILHQRLLYAKNAFFEKKRARIVSLSKMVFSPEREIGRYFQRLDEIETRIRHGIQRILRDRQHHIEKLTQDVNSYNPQNMVSMYRHKMETSINSLFRNFSHIIALKKSEFHGVVARLDSLSPLAILSRGYSITYKLPGRSIVKTPADVQHGDMVEVKLHEGTISCLVEEV